MIAKKTDRVVRRRKSASTKKPREKKNLRHWFFVFCVGVFFGVLVYVFLCSHLVSIDRVDVHGTKRVQSTDISRLVENMLSGTKFGCVKNNNYFLFDQDQIIEKIKEDQRIKSVEISRIFPKEISVHIVEYDIVPVWCVGSLFGSCFELDQLGCALRKIDINSQLVQENKHFIVVDHGHEMVSDDQCVISEGDLNKIQLLGEELVYSLNVEIKQPYIIDFRGSGEIKFESDEGWYILVDLDHDINEILHVARLFAKKVELPSVRSDLDYVDLRFPEKMFYKMRDGVEKEIEEDGDGEDDLEEDEPVDDEE